MKTIKIFLALLLATVISERAFAQGTATSDSLLQEVETRKVVGEFLKYAGEQSPDKIASLVAENVDWYIFKSPLMPWTGVQRKRSEIPKVFKSLFAAYKVEGQTFSVHGFFIQGKTAAVFGEVGRIVKTTGKSFVAPFAMHFTVENNLIIKFLMLEETSIMESALRK